MLLKAQIYKLFRSKCFYSVLFINIIVNIIGVFAYWVIQNDSKTASNVKGYSLMYKVISNGGIEVFEVMAIIFVALYVASEYKDGNIRSEISYGYRRSAIYFSKLLSSVLGVSIIIASSMITGIAAGSVLFGFGSDISSQLLFSLIKTFVMIIFVSSAFSSIYIMLCFLFKEPGIIISVYIAFTVLISNFLVAQLSLRFEWFKKVTDCMLQSQLYNVSTLKISGETAVIAVIYTAAVIIISSVIGSAFFNKADGV
ncbi:MAG TPA: ABC transporter permease [Clostridia bacterium]|nr:ABC transporter permease [Clostridia bacterium]